MVVAVLSGGGSRFNLPGSGDSKGLFEFFRKPSVEELPQETSRVLGAYTDSIIEIFKDIPVGVWIILAISVVLAVLAAVVINLFIRNWAKGALIAAIHDIEDQKQVSLRSGSNHGLSVVKRFILLHILAGVIMVALILVLAILMSVLFGIAIGFSFVGMEWSMGKTLLAGISVLTFVIAVVTGGVLLTMTVILAEQLVIRQDLSTKGALKRGFILAKRYIFQMIGMGAINIGIGCALGCATLILLVLLVAIVLLIFAVSKEAGFIAAAIAGILILAFALLSILIKGIYMVFTTSTWTLLVREIEHKEQEGVSNE